MSDSLDEPEYSDVSQPLPDPSLGRFLDDHEELVQALSVHCLESAAARVGGMLTMPEIQASIVRFEVLQHLIVGAAGGTTVPDGSSLKSWLDDLGRGLAGRLEDPAEDVFVSRVSGPDADYLVLDGIYEGSAYYLQRFLNVLQGLPREETFNAVRRSVYALLALINEVARRASLDVYTVGTVMPFNRVPDELVQEADSIAERVLFSTDEIAALNIDVADLKPFIFDDQQRTVLRDERLGHSSLEQTPILRTGESLCLALPTAVSMTIRRLIIEICLHAGLNRLLYRAYAHELAEAFSRIPILGASPSPRIRFQSMGGILFTNVAHYIDQGRLLHMCFVVDDFFGYEESGAATFRPDTSPYGSLIATSINQVFESFKSKPEFREGLTVVVLCPWGRPMTAQFEGIDDPRWRIETVPAVDLEALSWASGFSPHTLWSLLDARDALAQQGVELFNINGVLNLYAWSEQLEGHLIPHADLPNGELEGPLTVIVQQNALLDLRRKGALAWDVHRALTADGRIVQLRRYSEETLFEEDRNKPLYVSFDDVEEGELLAAYETAVRSWWITIDTPEAADRDLHYRLWHALVTWLKRSAEVLEAKFPGLADGPISWHCTFEDENPLDPEGVIPDYQQAKALLDVHADGGVVHVTAKRGFLFSFRHPTNVGESLLVEALVSGTATLASAKVPKEQVEAAFDAIVPSEWARDMHLLVAKKFRDFVGQEREGKILLIEKADDAFSRIGLGWRARKREEGGRIVGVEDCCTYLNAVIDSIWQDVKASLKEYARVPALLAIVSNHEATMLESERWLYTARSLLAFHDGEEKTARVAASQVAKYNASSLSARILMEMVLCECPDEGDLPGRIDLSRLMANVIQMHYLGGCSEAIRYGSKHPEVRIRPFGDVHTHIDFDDRVATPYGIALGSKRFRYGAESYETRFNDEEPLKSAQGKIDDEFWQAWIETFGFTIDELRVFMDNLENEGVRRGKLMFIATEADLIAMQEIETQAPETIRRILNVFALKPRSTWASTPDGFRARDWYPWRFRRRLSVISRPILQLTDDEAGAHLIVPGMIRDGAAKVIEYCHSGGYEAKDFPDGAMRSWIGAAENKRGHEFNKTVERKFIELGWQAKSDIKPTEILNAKLDRDYGDVDVLAWREGRIIAVECKDLELAMTNSDVARQLHDFRGEIGANGKPDRLKKHLMRVDVLNDRRNAVAKFVGNTRPIEIEVGLVFSDIVPLYFTDVANEHNVRLTTIDELHMI